MIDVEVYDIETTGEMELQCPNCRSQKAFDVSIDFTIRANKNNDDEPEPYQWEAGNCEMSDHDATVCLKCGHVEALRNFKCVR